jgi:hypothetical protein
MAAYSHKLTADLKYIILHASYIFWIPVLELFFCCRILFSFSHDNFEAIIQDDLLELVLE